MCKRKILQLGPRYRIQKMLGEGGMGRVYLAHDREQDRLVAMKFLRPELGAALASMQEEVRLLARLSHPRLVQIFDYHELSDSLWEQDPEQPLSASEWPFGPCFTMEFLPGQDLERSSSELDGNDWLSLLAQLCQGLHYLHAHNILHRDLKPSNVWWADSKEAKLLDFGLAAPLPADRRGGAQGTLAYLAPEACFGGMEGRSDLYSLGVLCYEGLAGRLPYAPWPLQPRQPNPAVPLASLRPDLPAFLCGLVDRMVEPDPVRRPASPLSVLRYLNQHVETPFPILSGEITEAVLQRLPLFGRDSELGDFWDAVARVGHGTHPVLIEISGPTGSGRSRFLEENRCPLQLRGFHCVAIEVSGQPWWRQLLLGLGELAEHADPLKLAEQARSSAGHQPLALFFQDLHAWDEPALQELRLFLRLSFHGPNRLLLVLERNSDLTPSTGLDGLLALSREWPATGIALSDLDPDAAQKLIGSVPLAKPLPTAVAKVLIQGAGGRPWLLLELLRRYLNTGSSPETRGAPQFAEKLREVTQLRVRELDLPSQRLLALLATHPFVFEVAELEDLWEGESDPWQEALLNLDRRGFIRAHGPERSELHLAQPSLRETYARALPASALAQAHRQWILHLERKLGSAAQPSLDTVALAEHAYQAEAKALAKTWGNAAAEFFERDGKVPEALDWYQRLLPWAETPKERYLLHGASAPLFYRLGRLDKALDSYDAWFRERPDDETRLQEATHLFYTGLVLFAMGRETEARKRFESCLEIGKRGQIATHRPFHARSLAFLASMEEKSNRGDAAKRLLEEALDIAAGNPFLLGDIEQRLGELEQSQLHFHEAAEHFSASLAHFQAAGRPQAQAVALQFLAMLRNEAGHSAEALSFMAQALDLSRDSGQLLQWARYQQNKALIHMEAADYGAADRAMERAREVLEVLGTQEDQRRASVHRLDLAIRVGNWDRAERLLEKLEAEASRDEERLAELLPCKAEWHYLREDFPRAQQEFEKFLKIAGHNLKRNSALSAELGLCRAKARQGALSAQDPCLRSALSALDGLRAPHFSLWKIALPLLAGDGLEADQLRDFEGLTSRIEAMGRDDLAADLYELLALALDRHGLSRSAQRCRAAAMTARIRIHQRLPEELQMDFEKNRRIESWDQALSEKLAPNPPVAAAVPGAPAKVSEQRFRQYSEISRQITQRNDLAGILERVMDAAIELTGAERGFLLLRNEAAKKKPLAGFEVRTARHLNQQSLGQEDFQISMTAVKQAIDQGATLLTGNAQLDPRLQEKKSVVQFQLKAILAVPLELEGKVIGAIYLDHRYHPSCFNEEDIVFLNAFAAQAALAIQKAQLIQELNQAKDRLEQKVETQAQRIEALSDELTKASEQRGYGYEDIVGRSSAMMEVFHLLDNVTDTLIPVWVHGESGTGKELVARSLHFNSSRKNGPFVAQNCSAIPEALLESELFGHKKGAFTHADRDRSGLFEQANGGTLFLDEVADMSLSMQVKLLRVLQDSEVRPLGSNKSVKVDVRLVTASNKNLEKLVEEEKFRQDLFFRINGITIALPPLRDRREDIPLLVNYLVKKICRDFKLKPSEISDKAFQRLVDYPWPGNIRQLEAVLRNALLFAKGRTITPEFLSIAKGQTPGIQGKAEAALPAGGERREEKQLILDSLRKSKMNKRLAAEDLGISLRSLYMRMVRHGIPKSKPVLAKFLGLKD